MLFCLPPKAPQAWFEPMNERLLELHSVTSWVGARDDSSALRDRSRPPAAKVPLDSRSSCCTSTPPRSADQGNEAHWFDSRLAHQHVRWCGVRDTLQVRVPFRTQSLSQSTISRESAS